MESVCVQCETKSYNASLTIYKNISFGLLSSKHERIGPFNFCLNWTKSLTSPERSMSCMIKTM